MWFYIMWEYFLTSFLSLSAAFVRWSRLVFPVSLSLLRFIRCHCPAASMALCCCAGCWERVNPPCRCLPNARLNKGGSCALFSAVRARLKPHWAFYSLSAAPFLADVVRVSITWLQPLEHFSLTRAAACFMVPSAAKSWLFSLTVVSHHELMCSLHWFLPYLAVCWTHCAQGRFQGCCRKQHLKKVSFPLSFLPPSLLK